MLLEQIGHLLTSIARENKINKTILRSHVFQLPYYVIIATLGYFILKYLKLRQSKTTSFKLCGHCFKRLIENLQATSMIILSLRNLV